MTSVAYYRLRANEERDRVIAEMRLAREIQAADGCSWGAALARATDHLNQARPTVVLSRRHVAPTPNTNTNGGN